MEDDFELQWSELANPGPNRPRHPRLARPRGLRRHFGPFIDDVDIDCLT